MKALTSRHGLEFCRVSRRKRASHLTSFSLTIKGPS
jgi:hypothetical protein